MQKRPKGWQTALDDLNHVGELLVTISGTAYTAQDIVACEVERNLLDSTAEIGNAAAAVLTLQVNPQVPVPKQAEIAVQYRLRLDEAYTDYIPKGRYWVNTREPDGRYIKLTCYDAMLKAEQDYLTDVTADDWPRTETDCVAEIAARIGVEMDPRTEVKTGTAHMVNMPIGKTMRDVLRQIGVTNGGNWCISEAGKLWLVPLAGNGDETESVGGTPDDGTRLQIGGVRLLRDGDDTPYTAGDMTADVLEADLPDGTQANADELLNKLKGLQYQPYKCEQRHIDPLAENGDAIQIGGARYVLYNIKQSVGPSFYADLEAPADEGELEQEYPYLTTAQRVKKQVVTLQRTTAEIRKDQQSITAEVAQTKKDVAENAEDIQKAMDTAKKESDAALAAAKEYTANELKSYSTTEETKSLLTQTQNSITAEVSKTYVTTATYKEGLSSTLAAAKDYTTGQLKSYSTTEETKSLLTQTESSITAEVSKTYATKDALGDYTKKDSVRSAFAMDATSIKVESGLVAFEAGTITISSDHFNLDAKGNVTATGTFTSVKGDCSAALNGGQIELKDGGDKARIGLSSDSLMIQTGTIYLIADTDVSLQTGDIRLNSDALYTYTSKGGTNFKGSDAYKSFVSGITLTNFSFTYMANFRAENGGYAWDNYTATIPYVSGYSFDGMSFTHGIMTTS